MQNISLDIPVSDVLEGRCEKLASQFDWDKAYIVPNLPTADNSLLGRGLHGCIADDCDMGHNARQLAARWLNTQRLIAKMITDDKLWICLESIYFAESENFLLKVLYINIKVSWNSTVKSINSI